MKEHLISQFIDDQLNLDEKLYFVETICVDRKVKKETRELLIQEKRLRGRAVSQVPEIRGIISPNTKRSPNWIRPLILGLSAAAAILIVFFSVFMRNPSSEQAISKPHRFVIYRPDVKEAEIAGTFTGWKPKAMNRIGDSGYWEIEMELPGGEHRYAYILEKDRRIADPTVPVREKDDFGGENSILRVST